MKDVPNIASGISITAIEVWVTNKTGNYNDARNIVAFVDLGETGDNLSNTSLWSGNPGQYPSNETNNLYSEMTSTYAGARNISNVSSTFDALNGFKAGKEYEKVENEYKLNLEVHDNKTIFKTNKLINEGNLLSHFSLEEITEIEKSNKNLDHKLHCM